MEFELVLSWNCGYCKTNNYCPSTYCSSCFISFKQQPKVFINELYRKQILLYWTNKLLIDLSPNIHKKIWNYFYDKINIDKFNRPQPLQFNTFYSAGKYYTKYCNGKKWHKSLGHCNVDKYDNVNVYDCTNNNNNGIHGGHILFHFGFLKESYKNGNYSTDYETKGVYYYIKDGTILEI